MMTSNSQQLLQTVMAEREQVQTGQRLRMRNGSNVEILKLQAPYVQ